MIYTVSDIHGYSFKRFTAFLKQVGFGESDELFILGDIIDRGTDGAKYLEWLLYQPNVRLILGNHEAMMLRCGFVFDDAYEALSRLDSDQMNELYRWLGNGGSPTIKGLSSLSPETRSDILTYLVEAPLYEEITVCGRSFVLTHSGLGGYRRGKALSEYTPRELLWTRPALDTVYKEDFTVIHGHTPTWYYGEQYRGRIIKTDTWINIDVGAAGGAHPMLLRLDDMKELYAEA